MTILIEGMNVEDIQEVLKLENELFVEPWSEQDFLYEINENPFAYYLKMFDKDSKEIMGYIGFWITFEKAQITNVAIAKKYQGLKLSKLLMADAEKRMKLADCENSTLEVRISNVPALALYKSCGYKIVAIRKHYYKNGEDAYLMLKEF